MPADLTAAELIALLREHPGCCDALDVVVCDEFAECGLVRVVPNCTSKIPYAREFRRWLTGAAVEKCDELGIWFGKDDDGGYAYSLPGNVEQGPTWVYYSGRTPVNGYATRLHALLAGLEAHGKESK